MFKHVVVSGIVKGEATVVISGRAAGEICGVEGGCLFKDASEHCSLWSVPGDGKR